MSTKCILSILITRTYHLCLPTPLITSTSIVQCKVIFFPSLVGVDPALLWTNQYNDPFESTTVKEASLDYSDFYGMDRKGFLKKKKKKKSVVLMNGLT